MEKHFPKTLLDAGCLEVVKTVKKTSRRYKRHQIKMQLKHAIKVNPMWWSYDEFDFEDNGTFKDTHKGMLSGRGSYNYDAPLRNWLIAQVGRPWNDVHSEMSEVADKRSHTGYRFWEQVDYLVEKEPRRAIERASYTYGELLYVDPEDGVLRVTKDSNPTDTRKPWNWFKYVARCWVTEEDYSSSLEFLRPQLAGDCYAYPVPYWDNKLAKTTDTVRVLSRNGHLYWGDLTCYVRKFGFTSIRIFAGTDYRVAYRQGNYLTRKERKAYFKLHPMARKLITVELDGTTNDNNSYNR